MNSLLLYYGASTDPFILILLYRKFLEVLLNSYIFIHPFFLPLPTPRHCDKYFECLLRIKQLVSNGTEQFVLILTLYTHVFKLPLKTNNEK